MSSEKCEKCASKMTLCLIEKGELVTTEIWRCTNLRCGNVERHLTFKKR